LAARTKNHMLANYLIEQKVKQIKNVFGELPSDIAMKNGDINMIEILLGYDKLNQCLSTNAKLTSKLKETQSYYDRVTNINDLLKEQTEKLRGNVITLERNNKRLREDLDTSDRELKRTKMSNEVIMKENDELKKNNKNVKRC
jgi:chromosome segregation ATPase